MGFTWTNIDAYTDELSFDLISRAVLTTDLMEKIEVRTGLQAGTVAINLLDGDLNVSNRACGFDTPSGDINFSQVDIVIADKQVKMEVCTNDLHTYYTSQYMTNDEDVVFEAVIADYYVQKLRAYNEGFLINGDLADTVPGTTAGLKAQLEAAITAGDITPPAGAAAWNVGNAIDQALDLYDAIGEEVKDRDDLIMVVSPANYRTLMRALVAADFRHYNFGAGESLILPGTNCEVVKSSGLTGSNFVFAGPAGFIIAGTGLTDSQSSFGMFYSPADDIVKVRAYWRLGVAAHQKSVFAANGL